jgi:hypothetical protein
LANFTTPQRQLFARSERVKGIDVHPTEPCTLRFDFSQPCDTTMAPPTPSLSLCTISANFANTTTSRDFDHCERHIKPQANSSDDYSSTMDTHTSGASRYLLPSHVMLRSIPNRLIERSWYPFPSKKLPDLTIRSGDCQDLRAHRCPCAR